MVSSMLPYSVGAPVVEGLGRRLDRSALISHVCQELSPVASNWVLGSGKLREIVEFFSVGAGNGAGRGLTYIHRFAFWIDANLNQVSGTTPLAAPLWCETGTLLASTIPRNDGAQ